MTDDQRKNNPDRALCRYEYMELLVRLAMIKYGLNSKSTGIAGAVRKSPTYTTYRITHPSQL